MISEISIAAFWDELEKIGAMSLKAIPGVNKMIRKAVPIPPIPKPSVRKGVGLIGDPKSWTPAIPEYAR